MNKTAYHTYLASREWALLREAVRERCGGTCERCGKSAMDSTHHLTYERMGQEKLTDLLGVCDQCHEFLSGKRGNDPARMNIYLIGKCSGEKWEFAKRVGIKHYNFYASDSILRRDGAPLELHHDITSGYLKDVKGSGRAEDVAHEAFSGIDSADKVVAYIDDDTAYGSLVELGYAMAKGPVEIFAIEKSERSLMDFLWLPCATNKTHLFACRCLDDAVSWFKFLYDPTYSGGKCVRCGCMSMSLPAENAEGAFCLNCCREMGVQ